MRSAGCVLVLGALFSAACQRANPDAQDGSSSSPGDLAAPPAADLAAHGAGDLAPVAEPDLAPPPETITICPDDQHMDSGTNSVVRVHAAWRIDTTTVSPMSLVV